MDCPCNHGDLVELSHSSNGKIEFCLNCHRLVAHVIHPVGYGELHYYKPEENT